ncbi:zinc finger CCHC domain-containing protein 9-like [Maniola hyperantus]|uniref:zinc finger CCHC domain-containing protein 9-like n=1 Tax=Aphantopus hyperantus TaxID=2795564 RepID=UPI001567DD7C|nr:uncharacterized protein LOC117991098 [Maniola hyperantus]
MTRFARAQGSKASNLKSPEDSTPWEVMKEQLLKSKKENEESKNREEAEKQRIENYNNFLKDQKTQKRKATWCDFPEAQTNKKINSTSNESENNAKNKKKKVNRQSVSNPEENLQNGGDCGDDHKINKSLKKKNKSNNIEQGIEPSAIKINDIHQDVKEATEINQVTTNQIQQTPQKKKKKKKEKQSTEIKANTQTDESVNTSEKELNQADHNSQQTDSRKKKNKKNKKRKIPESNVNEKSNKSDNNTEQKVSVPNQPSPSKKRKDKQARRKPVNDNSFQLIINSKEVQLVRYDGFPIMKRDAERLEELKKSMITKGIPKSEVQRTMKLERRRAEKALARLKRDVCYNCRKGGHNLSDCPDLKANIPGAGADGVCFKCGSTEHRQFECKVQRDKEFRFATCFICKEAGHIARQCPDNPKGLYPNGGGCKLCGDVTHLRKDCPTVNEKKESTSIKLQTLTDDNIEDIGQNNKQVSEEPVSKKPKKIKF